MKSQTRKPRRPPPKPPELNERPTEKTVAAVVREQLGCSWNDARGHVEHGRVRVNGVVCDDSAARMPGGASLEIDVQAPKIRKGVLDASRIVHVDRDIVVVDKPKGTLTLPYENERDTLVDLVRAALRRADRSKVRFDPPLGVVHRIDKDTTGLLVFARSLHAKRFLEDQFRAHTVERAYLALVHGEARDAQYDTHLIEDRGDGLRGSWGVFRRPKTKVPPADAQRALTFVHVVKRLRGATLVECRLRTGRQHQIRIHLAEAGFPLIGEPVYIRDFNGRQIEAERPMLHAKTLGFVHPKSEERVRFEGAPPEDFETLMRELT
jgi:23S rRNA pseudouridine1911/1915/1917 synthase